jgi:AraC family transcriptional regulator
LAKIALELERALARRAELGTDGTLADRILAHGDGWSVRDVICTAGPKDPSFDELHSIFYVAIVAAGSFQYRAQSGQELMTPGSLLLGHPGQLFTCGHEHGMGDRCISFGFTPEYFERVFVDAGMGGREATFPVLRVPPLRDLAPLVARACTALVHSAGLPAAEVFWEELALRPAVQTVRLVARHSSKSPVELAGALARVTRAVRKIEQHPDAVFTLTTLAQHAGLSPYHFLRLFARVTGVTPHQYILRTRLREAACRLASDRTKILDVALDCGFGDVSNFNRTFRSEFGYGPRAYRRQESGHFQAEMSRVCA